MTYISPSNKKPTPRLACFLNVCTHVGRNVQYADQNALYTPAMHIFVLRLCSPVDGADIVFYAEWTNTLRIVGLGRGHCWAACYRIKFGCFPDFVRPPCAFVCRSLAQLTACLMDVEYNLLHLFRTRSTVYESASQNVSAPCLLYGNGDSVTISMYEWLVMLE